MFDDVNALPLVTFRTVSSNVLEAFIVQSFILYKSNANYIAIHHLCVKNLIPKK